MNDTTTIVIGLGVMLLVLWAAPLLARWFIRRVHDKQTCRVCVNRRAAAQYELVVAEARQRHASRRGTTP